MKSENRVIEKNVSSQKYLDKKRSTKEYGVDKNRLSEGEDYMKNLFSLFLERVCINESVPLGVLMNTVERSIIIRTLSMVNGSQKDAAKILGLKYTTLNEKIKKYNIQIRKSVHLNI